MDFGFATLDVLHGLIRDLAQLCDTIRRYRVRQPSHVLDYSSDPYCNRAVPAPHLVAVVNKPVC